MPADQNQPCKWCGCPKGTHSNGKGACRTCNNCNGFRTTGETQHEFTARMASQYCETHGGHKFDPNRGDCTECGTKEPRREPLCEECQEELGIRHPGAGPAECVRCGRMRACAWIRPLKMEKMKSLEKWRMRT